MIRHGRGVFIDEKKRVLFEGMWENDFPTVGIFMYNDEYSYNGQF